MTPQEHYDEAERLCYNAQRQGGNEALKMLATAQVHATLALAGYTRDAAANATCAHGTVGFCAPCLALVKEGGTLA